MSPKIKGLCTWHLGEFSVELCKIYQVCLLECSTCLSGHTEQVQDVMLNPTCILLAASGGECCLTAETIESHLGPARGPGVLESSDSKH